jgi:hypothetical protein
MHRLPQPLPPQQANTSAFVGAPVYFMPLPVPFCPRVAWRKKHTPRYPLVGGFFEHGGAYHTQVRLKTAVEAAVVPCIITPRFAWGAQCIILIDNVMLRIYFIS